jgi:xanthine dehydrogenase YagT iron-sulfur-binding subunit
MTEDETSDALSDGAGQVGPDRRTVLIGTASVVGATVIPAHLKGLAYAEVIQTDTTADASGALTIDVHVNGRAYSLALDPRSSLLDVLRERLGLTGCKKGCDHGQCGACTVHLDGRRIASCLTPAMQTDGRQVLTVEGLSGPDGDLHPMQQAFIDHDALQCGYCTPGQIMAAVACVQEGHVGSADEIREYMSGNLCRCGAYVGIVGAIQDAAVKMQRG